SPSPRRLHASHEPVQRRPRPRRCRAITRTRCCARWDSMATRSPRSRTPPWWRKAIRNDPTERGRQMSWDFSTDPEWAQQLKWVEDFVRTECEPIDLIVKESHDLNDPVRQALIPPLQAIVKERGLWATHLGPHLGGPGYGQVKLALLNEILGRSECAPIV